MLELNHSLPNTTIDFPNGLTPDISFVPRFQSYVLKAVAFAERTMKKENIFAFKDYQPIGGNQWLEDVKNLSVKLKKDEDLCIGVVDHKCLQQLSISADRQLIAIYP